MPERLAAILRGLGVGGILLAAVSFPSQVAYATWADHRALKDEWKIPGPACPAPAHAWRWPAPRTIHYKGVAFARQYGGIYCEAVPVENPFSQATFPVCQFSGPGRVLVTLAGRTTAYEPGIGKPATVTVRDGRVSCVVASWWR
jgi:hypothetical protein